MAAASPHLRPHQEASDPTAWARAPSPEAQACPHAPACLCVRGPGRSPHGSLHKGTMREAGTNGLGVHGPPEQSGLEEEERCNRQSAHQGIPSASPTCSFHLPPHVRPGPEGWGTGMPRSLCWPQRSETASPERISLPLRAGSPARPPHPSILSCPHIARPFQQPAASTPSPQPPLQNISLGEMSILLLCLISGSVVYLLSCKSSFMKG